MRRLAFMILLLGCFQFVSAQKPSSGTPECQALIKTATADYQSGLFPDCIKISENILASYSLTRNDKQQVLEIIARAYCETGDIDKAESTVNILLKNFPHYELNESDNPESFNRLVKKFRVHPLLTIGAKNTANWLRHKTTKVYSVLSALDYSPTLVETGYWFTYYGFAEFEFDHGISLSVDAMFFYNNFRRNFSKSPSFSLSYYEEDNFIEFPVYIKKYFYPAKNFLIYGAAGMGPFMTYYAKGNAYLSYKKADLSTTGKDQDFDGSLENINVLKIKNCLNWQWNAGFGAGYTIKNLRFFVDVRYLSTFESITAPEKSEKISELRNDYFYIDQEMKLNQFEIGATISYTLFNSVKRIRY